MRLPVNPWVFLGRLLAFFVLTFLLWKPVAPAYTQLLLQASRVGLWLTELSTDPLWHQGTTLVSRGTHIFYSQRNFGAFNPPIPPQGIPAEWVMANLLLLIPLMLATPAPSWRARIVRLLLACAIALLLQVADVIIGIKSFYATTFRGYWSPWAAQVYQFLDVFFQSWDTQLFPFAVWAGIHFRQLLGGRLPTSEGKIDRRTRAERRRGRRRR